MSRILIVDDEANIREVIREYAEFHGYDVEEAEDGMEAVKICKEREFDIIVMDVMMPKLDGFSASKEIRKIRNTPILMLSARGEEYDKLFGFEMGIDDYVVKPFSPKELMMRIGAILKRYVGQTNTEESAAESTADETVFTFNGLRIDTLGRSVTIDGERTELTLKEYELLIYLVTNKNIAFTRDKLLNAVWGYDFFGDDRTVDTHIKMLRNNLGKYRDYIVTLRGVGYKFEIQS